MIDISEYPIGFAMELAMQPEAMNHFSGLDEQRQRQVVDGARQVGSRREMHDYVLNTLGKEGAGHEAERFF